ncbi:hypothetical protein ES332_A06G115700v1 [Gossypium tomentosum]|uniref:Uncharacterized protein n=1 Tax=Gossypium tomentosum TaxID=34277 RepID=A0A5D2Q4S1_GOSTO|nr:hypothetical protein ES332_A06G115700v1 [Gossypium tomentosum]
MKRRVSQWIIFIIVCFLSETAFISPSQATVNDLKQSMKEKQLKDFLDRHEKTIKGWHEALHLKMVQREKKVIIEQKKKGGKGGGSYGGGSLLRPRAKKSAANFLHRTTFLRFLLPGLIPTMFFFL